MQALYISLSYCSYFGNTVLKRVKASNAEQTAVHCHVSHACFIGEHCFESVQKQNQLLLLFLLLFFIPFSSLSIFPSFPLLPPLLLPPATRKLSHGDQGMQANNTDKRFISNPVINI